MPISDRQMKAEVRRILESRSIAEQQRIARKGIHPFTGRWWPAWKPWTPTNMMRSILSRFTSGYYGTGRAAAIRQAGTAQRRDASRLNARKPRPRARLANRGQKPASGPVIGDHSRPGDRGAR